MSFFAVDPTTSLFQCFFVVLLYHSNRSRSDNQIFHWEKQTFFQLLSVLTMSPRRRCNLTSWFKATVSWSGIAILVLVAGHIGCN